MSLKVTISSITANTPVDVYYCDSMSANCQYVSTVEKFPFEFFIDSPFDEQDVLIKIVDIESFVVAEFIHITPTPTPNTTPTLTPTLTQTLTPNLSPNPTSTPTITKTPTLTITPTLTKTVTNTITATVSNTPTLYATPTLTPTLTTTPTLTVTKTQTPTNTASVTPTPLVAIHQIGNYIYNNSTDSCLDKIILNYYYSYIAEANNIPIIGATIYTTLINGSLYNKFNGQNGWLKMKFGNDFYSVNINEIGLITNFTLC